MSTKGNPEQAGGLLSMASAQQAADAASVAASPKPRVSSQAVVLAAILIGAGGLLWGMRHMGMGPKMSLASLKLEYERTDDGAEAKQRYAKVIAELAEAANPVQIKGEELGRNPFRLIATSQPASELASTADWQQNAEAEAAARQAELERKQREAADAALAGAIDSLYLHSVIGGRVPLARIGNQTVTVGDRVADRFTVLAIEGRSVTLDAGGRSFMISIEDQREPSGRAKAKSRAQQRR